MTPEEFVKHKIDELGSDKWEYTNLHAMRDYAIYFHSMQPKQGIKLPEYLTNEMIPKSIRDYHNELLDRIKELNGIQE